MEYISENYKVYVKTDSSGIITAINSSAFLSNLTAWTEIDEGNGDKFHHAQGNYFDNGLTDENGVYNYKLIDGVAVERSDAEKAADLSQIAAAAERAHIMLRFEEIDRERIRPLAAIVAGTATNTDTEKLAALEAEAQELRTELAAIGGATT